MKTPYKQPSRLYYLDWLRVILIFGVFVYHVVKPFDTLTDWHINNAEESVALMSLLLLINPWGLPLFFFVSGAGSNFALRRRSNRQYINERVTRLLIPFIVAAILLTPFQRYLEVLHKGSFQGSFPSFLTEKLPELVSGNLGSPLAFSDWGLHLWFVAFLFIYSLLALPIINWFRRDSGKAFITWSGRLVEKRGGVLLFVIPLTLARALVQPFSPVQEHDWLDFVYFFLFFVIGYFFYTDDRFLGTVRRDRWLLFAGALAGLIGFFAVFALHGDVVLEEWSLEFVWPWSIPIIFFFVLTSWGFALNVLYLAMTRLNFTNRWLEYGNDTIMPFYLLHQPVIIVIAYYVVGWEAGVWPKLAVIFLGSLVVTLGIVELLIRPFRPVRRLFGMKPRRSQEQETKPAVA